MSKKKTAAPWAAPAEPEEFIPAGEVVIIAAYGVEGGPVYLDEPVPEFEFDAGLGAATDNPADTVAADEPLADEPVTTEPLAITFFDASIAVGE